MKALINYVVQGVDNHIHQSEILEITSPPYTFSPEVPMSEVIKWLEKKQKQLTGNQKLVLTSMYKM